MVTPFNAGTTFCRLDSYHRRPVNGLFHRSPVLAGDTDSHPSLFHRRWASLNILVSARIEVLSSRRKTCNFSQKPLPAHIRDLSPAASSNHSRSCSTVFWENCGSAACHKPRRILSSNDLIKRPGGWPGSGIGLGRRRGGGKGDWSTGRDIRAGPPVTSLFDPTRSSTLPLSVYRPPLRRLRTETSLLVFLSWSTVRPSTSQHPGLHRRHRDMDGPDDRLVLNAHGPSGDLNPSTPRQTGSES